MGGIPKFLLPNRQGRSLLHTHVSMGVGVPQIVVVTRPDLQNFVKSLLGSHGNNAVVLRASTQTMSETVHFALESFPAIQRFVVGLPDTAVLPEIPYRKLLDALEFGDLAVAAYPTRPDQAGRLGALRIEGNRCVEVKDKDPSAASWSHHWGAVAFKRGVFSAFSDPRHPHVGFALERAVSAGIEAPIAHFGSSYFDLGTVSELMAYFRQFAEI